MKFSGAPETNARIRELRRLADEARSAAGIMKHRGARSELLAIAETYDRVADDLDSPN
jgi:hypothetical protein